VKYIFGPVFSRRLGFSLGVDLVPYKVCSMDCIYCEVGKTTEKLTERAEYVPLSAVIKELEEFLATNPEIDYITFSGYGEPTLFSRLGELVSFLKENYPYKLALLTNATLLKREDVLRDVQEIDVVLPSLDAGSEEVFRKVNRPAESIKLKDVVDGIRELKKRSKGKLWIETLFVKGVNDSEEEVLRIGELVKEIAPEKWQLNTVARPPAYEEAKPLSYEELLRIKELVGYEETEIVVKPPPKKSGVFVEGLKEEIYSLVVRRPCTVEELAVIASADREDVEAAVEELLREGRVREISFGGEPYIKGVSCG